MTIDSREPSRRALVTLGTVATMTLSSAVAFAQPAYECKSTETQPECHTRLKCRVDEELEVCQKRLRSAGGGNQNQDQNRGNDDGPSDVDDGRTRDDRRRGNDRWNDDNDDRDRGRRARSDRGNDRWNDDDDGGRRSSRRGRRGRSDDGGGGGGGGGGGRSSRAFEANKTFGLGLELGQPSGLTGKYFLSSSTALDFGLGAVYSHYYYGDGLHLYVDHLWHPVSLASTDSFELPFYVGVGGRFWSFEYCDRNFCYDGSAVGLRVPLGIAFDFNNVPLDIFLQLVPTLDFVTGDYYDRYDDDRAHFGVDGSVGVRFWFK